MEVSQDRRDAAHPGKIANPALFWDIGNVLLTNAWDTPTRKAAVEHFGLEEQDFQARHGMLKTAFETGRLSLDGYLRKSVFYRSRPFSPTEFKQYMYAQSKPLDETLEWARALANAGCCRMFTLNNESRELHEYRVRAFKLDRIFRAFFTSCYLGQVKPDEDIYLNALGIAGCDRSEAVFIDDRALNVEPAAALGLHAIHFKGLDQLRNDLKEFGIEA